MQTSANRVHVCISTARSQCNDLFPIRIWFAELQTQTWYLTNSLTDQLIRSELHDVFKTKYQWGPIVCNKAVSFGFLPSFLMAKTEILSCFLGYTVKKHALQNITWRLIALLYPSTYLDLQKAAKFQLHLFRSSEVYTDGSCWRMKSYETTRNCWMQRHPEFVG